MLESPTAGFRNTAQKLTRPEYDHLLSAAQSQRQERLALDMEAICVTRIYLLSSSAEYVRQL